MLLSKVVLLLKLKFPKVTKHFLIQTEDLDVQSQAIDQSMGAATTLSTPADQVRVGAGAAGAWGRLRAFYRV